ncbi:hypothetical protein PR048_002419 [Dryococelus australis]|uniref:Integrase catalytic domain-containing protein n=1 Tax=Dryococelus australis TaxID=614101 RepID=A0ABQ9IK48_9NEOP|nr:hypothetical protein PR048_002419 [Dryococelus australis]
MYCTVSNVIVTYLLCAQTKVMIQKCQGAMAHVYANEPLQTVCVDLIGPLPIGKFDVKYIPVAFDAFSKYVKLYPIIRATAKVITEIIMYEYFVNIGQPKKIISDNDPNLNGIPKTVFQEEYIYIVYADNQGKLRNQKGKLIKRLALKAL